MLKKILSILLLIPALILSNYQKPYEPDSVPENIVEEEPVTDEYRTNDKINGNGCLFYIARPLPQKLNEVHSSQFGMSPELEDNTAKLNEVLLYCKNNPRTKLVIDKGTYYFSESNKLSFDRISDCYIEATGAEFIFGSCGTFFNLSLCNCLEINGLTVDVDRVNNPVDDVLKIQNSDPKNHTTEFCFFEKETVDKDMIFSAITQCDPETLTFGAKGKNHECYIYQNPQVIKKVEQVTPNTLKITHDGVFDRYRNGETYILRHHVYDGQVFHIGNQSKNITFNNVKIYGSFGSGYGADGLASHYQIINSTIGIDPHDKTGAHVSQGADGIHIAGSGGFFNLENCDISCQGDDALNIHDGIGYVFAVDKNTIRMYSTQTRLNVGEYLAFKDSGFSELGFKAKISSFRQGESLGTEKVVTFEEDVSDIVKPGCIVYNTLTNSGNYVIRNNYFHENRARALLLQSDNGICENNRFYKVQGQAIKIVMDIRPSLWQEGTGVNNLIIRNNTFDACDYSEWGEQITIDSYIDGHYADCCVFKNIEITGNTFENFKTKIINAMNVNGLNFTGNKISATNINNRIVLQNYCKNVKIKNEYSGPFADIASIVKAKELTDFIMQNSSLKEEG